MTTSFTTGGPSPLAKANKHITQLEQKINAMTAEHDNEVVALKAQIALNQRAADFYESEGWRVIDDALRDAEAELAAARQSRSRLVALVRAYRRSESELLGNIDSEAALADRFLCERDAARRATAASEGNLKIAIDYFRAHMAMVEHEDSCGNCISGTCQTYSTLEQRDWATFTAFVEMATAQAAA